MRTTYDDISIFFIALYNTANHCMLKIKVLFYFFQLPGVSGLTGFDTQTEQLTKYNASYYFKAADYKFKRLVLSKGNISERICDGPFCCDFTLNVSAVSANSTTAIYQ